MAKFEIDGSKYLLTWPKSGYLTIDLILRMLQDLATVRYAAACKEMHVDETEHHHAVVVFEKRIKKTKNVFDFGHGCNVKYLRTIADVKRAIKYVKKDGLFTEIGTLDERWTKLDKREKAYYALTHNNVECIDSGQFSFSELSRLQMVRNLFLMDWPQFKEREVHWYYGETGAGKTREAWDIALGRGYKIDQIWMSSGKLEPFFNGYTGQKVAILDDFRPGCLRFELLLRICDGYPVTINVKNGYVQWMAELIIITAPVKYNEMYVNRETGEQWDHLDQLARRVCLTKCFFKKDSDTEPDI